MPRSQADRSVEAAITEQFADDRAVLLLDPSLIVFPIRSRARQLNGGESGVSGVQPVCGLTIEPREANGKKIT